jgi:hypothetical protein
MFKPKLLFLFLIIFNAGCNIDRPCKDSNMVCPDSYGSLFRITSKTNGDDLIFGPSSLYDPSKIKIFSLIANDTTFAKYEPYRMVLDGYDSVLHFKISSKPDTLYIQLNSNDIDTISVSYGKTEGRCCSFNSIRTLNYNNSGALPNYNGTVEFRK